jgi:hypothetical protein
MYLSRSQQLSVLQVLRKPAQTKLSEAPPHIIHLAINCFRRAVSTSLQVVTITFLTVVSVPTTLGISRQRPTSLSISAI